MFGNVSAKLQDQGCSGWIIYSSLPTGITATAGGEALHMINLGSTATKQREMAYGAVWSLRIADTYSIEVDLVWVLAQEKIPFPYAHYTLLPRKRESLPPCPRGY